MRTSIYRHWNTSVTVSLIPTGGGAYKVMIDEESLGEFLTLTDAFVAAHGGNPMVDWSGGNLQTLNLPSEIKDWKEIDLKVSPDP